MINNTQKITLIGYMASGKTTIGEGLAKKLNCSFIDLDEYIAAKENMSISAFFEHKGEDEFRKVELKYLKELLNRNDFFILSLGGGTPTVDNAMTLITDNSICIYLKASVQTLTQRLLPDTIERPLLNSITEDLLETYIEGHLGARIPHYEKAAFTINVDYLDTNETIIEIIKKIGL
jgi:shikimate kinase